MVYYNTVNNLLKDSLTILMKSAVFEPFRLVGGTALSLQVGHRESVDIDLFCDLPYKTIDFKKIDEFIERSFAYHDHSPNIDPAIGKSYLIGEERSKAVKLDVYYTDSFIQPPVTLDNIRMATVEEIIAMKVDVVQRIGRKKDFWDLHELFPKYNLDTMLKLHEQRYPYSHNKNLIMQNFIDFRLADDDLDPICMRGKYWEFIKEDIIDFVERG